MCLLDKDFSDYTAAKSGFFGREPRCKSCIRALRKSVAGQPAEDEVAGPQEMQSLGPDQDEGPHDDELTVTEEEVEVEEEEEELWVVRL